MSGFGGKQDKACLRKRISCTLAPVDRPRCSREFEALTTAEICHPADAVEVNPANWVHLKDVNFPEEFPREQKPIDVLIGLDFYYSFVTRDIVKADLSEPVAVRTTLGWVLCGPTGTASSESTVSMNVQVSTNDQLNETLQSFWNLESIGIKSDDMPLLNKTEENVLNNFKESLTFKDGRYEVSIPWKENQVTLKSYYIQAERRLYSLEKRLLEDPLKAKIYQNTINKYVEDGIAEEVPANEIKPVDNRPVFHLPHHAVIREDRQKTKTRVVFDASAKDSEGTSMNSCIEAGPALQPDLCGIILRFRKKKIVGTSDIEKMFLQISLREQDRDSHRYLWRDLDLEAAPKVYRMTRVTFGVIASPFLAICTTQEHVQRNKELYPEVCDEILKNTYVDDFAFCRDEVNEARELQQSAKELMAQAAFNLTKWSSNSRELLKVIPEEDRAPNSLINLNQSFPENCSITKALGLKWDTNKDTLTYIIEIGQPQIETYTKRQVASCAAKVFDPIGLITPFTVRSKMLLQSLWTQGIGWDDKIPTETCRKWTQWLKEINNLENLAIPRCYVELPMNRYSRLELHAFGDASELAYASAVYLRALSVEGHVSTSLVMSKTRIAPVKRVTLPRLELMAAVITARLCTYVRNALDCQIDRIVCWTDNSSTLHGIRGSPSQWKPFVANRVLEIQSLLDPSVWRYCHGPQNPADVPTTGMSSNELKENRLWWEGPAWLRSSEEEWPKDLRSASLNEHVEIERKHQASINSYVIQPQEIFIDFTRFSKYNKLLRTIAWIKRYIHNARVKQDERRQNVLTGLEIQESEPWLVNRIQIERFSEEISLIGQSKALNDSKLRNLNPFLCQSTGLLRVGGRIHKAELPEEEKHPIILPSDHPAVELFVQDIHRREMHAGVEHTLSVVRQRFLLIKGRATIRKIVKTCIVCRQFYTKPVSQQMAPLPANRIVPAPPFTNVGLDFAGPLHLKNRGEKAYICLFTCAVTRAVHLELVSNMTTERFLLALRRMVARRGMCSIIWSDNAKTFKCAKKEYRGVGESWNPKKPVQLCLRTRFNGNS